MFSKGLVSIALEDENDNFNTSADVDTDVDQTNSENDLNNTIEMGSEIETACDALGEASQDRTQLGRYVEVLQKCEENGGAPSDTLDAIDISVESIFNRLGISRKATIVSLESYSSKTKLQLTKDYRVALEGTIGRIWQAIVEAVKKIFTYIGNFLTSVGKFILKLFGINKKNEQRVKNLEETKNNSDIDDDEIILKELNDWIQTQRNSGREISEKEIENKCQEIFVRHKLGNVFGKNQGTESYNIALEDSTGFLSKALVNGRGISDVYGITSIDDYMRLNKLLDEVDGKNFGLLHQGFLREFLPSVIDSCNGKRDINSVVYPEINKQKVLSTDNETGLSNVIIIGNPKYWYVSADIPTSSIKGEQAIGAATLFKVYTDNTPKYDNKYLEILTSNKIKEHFGYFLDNKLPNVSKELELIKKDFNEIQTKLVSQLNSSSNDKSSDEARRAIVNVCQGILKILVFRNQDALKELLTINRWINQSLSFNENLYRMLLKG